MPRFLTWPRRLASVLAAGLLVFGGIALVNTPSASATADGCTHNLAGQELVCIHVQGVGLFVGTAKVTNKAVPSGTAKILNTGNGVLHEGPAIHAGQSWSYNFNRNLKDGAQVCGAVGSSAFACVTIHS